MAPTEGCGDGQPGARERVAAGREVESDSSGEKAMTACPPRPARLQRILPRRAPFAAETSTGFVRSGHVPSHVAQDPPYYPIAGSVSTKDGTDYDCDVRGGGVVRPQPPGISVRAA